MTVCVYYFYLTRISNWLCTSSITKSSNPDNHIFGRPTLGNLKGLCVCNHISILIMFKLSLRPSHWANRHWSIHAWNILPPSTASLQWLHVRCPQGTVQTYVHRLGVSDGRIESLSCLTWQCTPWLVHEGSRYKHGNIQSDKLQVFSNRIQSSLRFQCVKDHLHHQNITSSVYQSGNLLEVGLHQLIKSHITSCRVLHQWTDRPSTASRTTIAPTTKRGFVGSFAVTSSHASQASFAPTHPTY